MWQFTQDQLNNLKQLFSEKGDDIKALEYSCRTVIKLSNCKSLLWRLRKRENINKSKNKKGARRRISKETPISLIREIKKNSKMTLKMMRLFCARIENQVANGNELITVDEEELYNLGPDESTIHMLINKRNTDYDNPLITMKRLSDRYVSSNTPENKEMSIRVINDLRMIGRGNIVIFLEESHWQVGFVRGTIVC